MATLKELLGLTGTEELYLEHVLDKAAASFTEDDPQVYTLMALDKLEEERDEWADRQVAYNVQDLLRSIVFQDLLTAIIFRESGKKRGVIGRETLTTYLVENSPTLWSVAAKIAREREAFLAIYDTSNFT